MTHDTRKETIIACLRKWIAQRPGLEFGNYGDVSAYRSEMRSITKDRHQAETLLRYVEWHDSITADAIIEAAKSAYSGRLRITEESPGRFVVDYCVGQYFPTEYRRAVCAVLSGAIWSWLRDQCMPEPTLHHNTETGELVQRYSGMRAGDFLRASAKREFGRSIANRWFS